MLLLERLTPFRPIAKHIEQMRGLHEDHNFFLAPVIEVLVTELNEIGNTQF